MLNPLPINKDFLTEIEPPPGRFTTHRSLGRPSHSCYAIASPNPNLYFQLTRKNEDVSDARYVSKLAKPRRSAS
jgi:hypothetical protein